MSKIRKIWDKKAQDFFVGKKIVGVRYLTEKEMTKFFGEEDWGSDKVPLAFYFDDDSWAFPTMDDEGNDGGALLTSTGDFPVISRAD